MPVQKDSSIKQGKKSQCTLAAAGELITEAAKSQTQCHSAKTPTFLKAHNKSESCKDINPTNRKGILSAPIHFSVTHFSICHLSVSTLFILVCVTDTFQNFGLCQSQSPLLFQKYWQNPANIGQMQLSRPNCTSYQNAKPFTEKHLQEEQFYPQKKTFVNIIKYSLMASAKTTKPVSISISSQSCPAQLR